MSSATLSSKFQISVPKEVRDVLQLKPGQKIVFLRVGGSVRLMPQPTITELMGIARGADTGNYRDRERDSRRESVLPKLKVAVLPKREADQKPKTKRLVGRLAKRANEA